MRTSCLINNTTADNRIPRDQLTDAKMQYLSEEAWAYEYGRAEMAQVEFEKIDRSLMVAQFRKESPMNGKKEL